MSAPKEENTTKPSTSFNSNNNNNNDNSHINIDKLDIAVTEKSKVDFAKDKNYQYYPDKPDGNINKLKFAVKGASQFYDPCEESSKMSFKCLELNDYDKDMCRQYFDAYRECKKQWLSHRRSNGGQWK